MQEQNLELSNTPAINISPSLFSADKQETEDPFGKSPQTFDKMCVRQGVCVCVSNICCQWGSANIWEPFPVLPTPALLSAALDASTMDVKDKKETSGAGDMLVWPTVAEEMSVEHITRSSLGKCAPGREAV